MGYWRSCSSFSHACARVVQSNNVITFFGCLDINPGSNHIALLQDLISNSNFVFTSFSLNGIPHYFFRHGFWHGRQVIARHTILDHLLVLSSKPFLLLWVSSQSQRLGSLLKRRITVFSNNLSIERHCCWF